jgi:hypothetical protein
MARSFFGVEKEFIGKRVVYEQEFSRSCEKGVACVGVE